MASLPHRKARVGLQKELHPLLALCPCAQEARPGGWQNLLWMGLRAGPSHHTLLSQRGGETGGMPRTHGREDWRPGSQRLPWPLQGGQRCREVPGCGLSRACVRGPVRCDAESDGDGEPMCRQSSKGEKLLFISLPWKAQCIQRTPVRPGPLGAGNRLKRKAFWKRGHLR